MKMNLNVFILTKNMIHWNNCILKEQKETFIKLLPSSSIEHQSMEFMVLMINMKSLFWELKIWKTEFSPLRRIYWNKIIRLSSKVFNKTYKTSLMRLSKSKRGSWQKHQMRGYRRNWFWNCQSHKLNPPPKSFTMKLCHQEELFILMKHISLKRIYVLRLMLKPMDLVLSLYLVSTIFQISNEDLFRDNI